MRANHLSAAETDAYVARRLSAAEALEISDHLVECAECRALVRQAGQFRAPAFGFAQVTYEELAAVVDDELDPIHRREVMEKVGHSPRARAELADLAAFKREVATASVGHSRGGRSLRAWALPLAAALTAGIAFLWWSSISEPRGGAFALRDNGARVQIRPDGSVLGLPQFPPEQRSSLKNALTQNRIDVAPAIASLGGHAGNLAGADSSGAALRVVAPVGTVVEETKPTLAWTADPRATGYRVTIARENGADLVETADVPKDQPRWSPSRPLQPGETYEWQVQAMNGESVVETAPAPPQPEARFQVIRADARAELDQTLKRAGSSHLASAFAYARAGLIDKADAELAALQRENSNSPVPSQLRAALRNAVATPRAD